MLPFFEVDFCGLVAPVEVAVAAEAAAGAAAAPPLPLVMPTLGISTIAPSFVLPLLLAPAPLTLLLPLLPHCAKRLASHLSSQTCGDEDEAEGGISVWKIYLRMHAEHAHTYTHKHDNVACYTCKLVPHLCRVTHGGSWIRSHEPLLDML